MQSMQELENNNPDDIRYMKEAIRQAKKAAKLKEVPIGCVIVYDGKIIARGYNRRNTDKSTLAHADCRYKKGKQGDWRLEARGLYNVCHVRTMPDVFRGNRSGTYSAGCDRNNECQGRLCGVGHKYSSDGGLQPSRRYNKGGSHGGVP